jgi:hypothetical protein
MTELQKAEQGVSKMHALIDRQRRLIEELACRGHDITSASILHYSLVVSLSLYVHERHRLRSFLRDKADEFEDARPQRALA